MGAFWSVFCYNYVMNNFRKCCVFYNHISSWAPATRWGVEGEVGARPSPSWEHKITISIWGGLFTLLWGPFSPYEGPLFFFWGALFLPLHCFGGYFLHVRDYFSPYVENFSGMSSLTKIAASAHAFAARVVASVAHSRNLREIAGLNLLIHLEHIFM